MIKTIFVTLMMTTLMLMLASMMMIMVMIMTTTITIIMVLVGGHDNGDKIHCTQIRLFSSWLLLLLPVLKR